MSSTAAINLATIPAPEIFVTKTFEDLVDEKKEIIKQILPGWEPAESDDFSVIAESWAYDDLHHWTRFNNAIKAMLLPYSTGTDLDNLAAMYGVKRLAGTRPKAEYTFSLTGMFEDNKVIPKGTGLISADGKHTGIVCENIEFTPGMTKKTGMVELETCTKASPVRTGIFVNPIAYVKATATSNKDFRNGAAVESDDEFRERTLLSLYSFSTAGSKESYIYWTQSADARIRDVSVTSPKPDQGKGPSTGIVDIHVLADTYDDALWEACEKAASDSKRRPLTDCVRFHEAEPIMVDITAEIRLADLSMAEATEKTLKKKEELENMSFKLGEDLSLSKIYATLHTGDVVGVVLKKPVTDITVNEKQAIKIGTVKLNHT